jgi:hypothetical protein
VFDGEALVGPWMKWGLSVVVALSGKNAYRGKCRPQTGTRNAVLLDPQHSELLLAGQLEVIAKEFLVCWNEEARTCRKHAGLKLTEDVRRKPVSLVGCKPSISIFQARDLNQVRSSLAHLPRRGVNIFRGRRRTP